MHFAAVAVVALQHVTLGIVVLFGCYDDTFGSFLLGCQRTFSKGTCLGQSLPDNYIGWLAEMLLNIVIGT